MQTSLFNATATFNNALIEKISSVIFDQQYLGTELLRTYKVGPKSLISINSANLAFPFISFVAFLFIILKIMN